MNYIARWWLQISFIFTKDLREDESIFTIFRRGWNHQLVSERSTKLSNIKCGHVSFFCWVLGSGFFRCVFFFWKNGARGMVCFVGLQKNKGRVPVTCWDAPFTLSDSINCNDHGGQRAQCGGATEKKKREGGVIKGDWKVDIHPRYTTFMGCPEISMVMSRFSSPPKKGLLCWVEGCFSPKYQTWWCFSCRERSTKTTSQEIGVGNEHQNHDDDDDDDDDGCGGCMYCTLKLQSILMVQAPRILHGTMILWGHASHAPLDIFWEQGQYKIENTLGMQHPWDAALKTACRNCCRFSSKKKDYVY